MEPNAISQELIEALPALSSILLVYGPAALLLLVLFVVERRLRINVESANAALSRISTRLYPVSWGVAAILSVAVCILSGYTFFYGTTIIRGSFEGLASNEDLRVFGTSITGGEVYVVKAPITMQRNEYRWMIYSTGSIDASGDLKFVIFSLDDESSEEDAKELHVPLDCVGTSSNSSIRITYKRGARKATVMCAGKQARELKVRDYRDDDELEESAAGRPVEPVSGMSWSFGLRSAYAKDSKGEAAVDFALFAQALTSRNIATRKDAREALAGLGSVALPWIEQVLLDRSSDHLLKLGAIVALIRMSGDDAGRLSAAAKRAVAEAATGDDVVTRYNARVYLRNFAAEDLLADLEGEFATATRSMANPGDQSRRALLARALLDIRYKRGIDSLFQFRENPDRDDAIDKAIADFSAAWSYSKFAADDDATDVGERRLQFAKSQWGLGLAYHEAYWAKLTRKKVDDASLRKQAEQAFRQVVALADQPGYQHPKQVALARACLKSFTQTCTEPQKE